MPARFGETRPTITVDAAIMLGLDKGGKYENGGLVKLPLDGSEPIIVHEFEGGKEDGSMPTSLVASNGGTLFGTLNAGGQAGAGGLFSLDSLGDHYRFVHAWRGDDFHGNPRGPWLYTSGKDDRVYGYSSNFPSRGFAVAADGTVKLEGYEQYRKHNQALGPHVGGRSSSVARSHWCGGQLGYLSLGVHFSLGFVAWPMIFLTLLGAL